jgi:putative membrane protein
MTFTAPFIYMGHYFLLVIWLLPLLALPLIYLRWRKYRYGFDGEYGLISTGLFGYKHVLFPVFKVQQVVITQAIWQKPKGLADLTIHMAGSSMTIPYMPIEHARQWFDNIYYKIESDQRPWY